MKTSLLPHFSSSFPSRTQSRISYTVYQEYALASDDFHALAQNVEQIIPLADRFRVEWLATECERYVVSAKDMGVYEKLQAAELFPNPHAVVGFMS